MGQKATNSLKQASDPNKMWTAYKIKIQGDEATECQKKKWLGKTTRICPHILGLRVHGRAEGKARQSGGSEGAGAAEAKPRNPARSKDPNLS